MKKIRERSEEVKRVIGAGSRLTPIFGGIVTPQIQIMMESLKINSELATATYDGIWNTFSEDGNLPEDGLRVIFDEAKKTAKMDREVLINEVVDSSILKQAQRELE